MAVVACVSIALLVPLAVATVCAMLLSGKLSLLTRSPLAQTLRSTIGTPPLECPTFCTLAREVEFFDPDEAFWYTLDTDERGAPARNASYRPDVQRVWVPDYVNIQDLSPTDRVQICLASAALPFGIVPPIRIGDAVYVDGGIADNCPVYQFFDNEDIDEVFVVLLEPARDQQEALVRAGATPEAWSKLDHRIRVFQHPIPRNQRTWRGKLDLPIAGRNQPPAVVPYRTPQKTPRVRCFYPTSSLGSFLSGTMNFDSRYAVDLIAKGLADTRAAFDTEIPTGPDPQVVGRS
jgi:hypothetical protein